MDIEDRIKAAIERITSGQGSMRVPAEETDPDLVLADCLTEIKRLRAREDVCQCAVPEPACADCGGTGRLQGAK